MKKAIASLALTFLLLGLALTLRPVSAQTAKWTFMIYLDADNNLEYIGIDNFLSMAQVGSTDEVNIVVQFDRYSGLDNRYGDWSTTKRFLVGKGMTPLSINATQDLGELNMASPTVLSDFVKWAAATFPAERYFLDIWDHGLGWQGVATDSSPVPNDHMTAIELGVALEEIHNFLGKPLDILANDACRMTLEIMYQASPHVEYLVGSEKDEPAEGWPYDTVLGSLVANPEMGPVQLGSILVDRYVDKYRAGSSYSVTMAVVNSTALPDVINGLNGFVTALNFSLPYFVNSITIARNNSEHYEGDHCSFPMTGDDYDLYDVASKAQEYVRNGRVLAATESLKQAIRTAVIHEGHLNVSNAVNCVWAENAAGLSLSYPWTISGTNLKEYGQLAMSLDSLWDEHLRSYHNGTQPLVAFQASLTPEDLNSDSRLDNARLTFRPSSTGTVVVDQYLDGLGFSSQIYLALGGDSYVENISLPSPGIFDFYVYLRQSAGTANATSFLNILVTATLTFHGRVSDQYGIPVDQANLTISNLRTGQVASTTTSDGYYSLDIVYPSWARRNDIIRIEANKDGHSARLEFSLQYQGWNSYKVDLYLDTDLGGGIGETLTFGEYWPLMAVIVASIVIEIILLVRTWSRGGDKRKKAR